MTQNDFAGKYAQKKRTPLKPFYPIIGLLIAALAAVGAWFVAEPAFEFVRPYVLEGVSVPSEPIMIGTFQVAANSLVLATAFVIWLVIIALFAALFAVFQPRTTKLVDEKTLKSEKDAALAAKRRADRRKKAMKAKMRQANKDFDEI